MTKTTINIGKVAVPIFIIALIIFIYFGSENKIDPDWNSTYELIPPKVKTLIESEADLQSLLENFHNQQFKNQSLGYQLAADPFLPTMEFEKFKYFFDLLTKNKYVVFSSVTGTGSSTIIDRIANLVALDKERILKINCAPQFDLIYHKKYIFLEEDEKSKKGELLKFWDKCFEQPDKKFIAIIDNFDKINPETFFGPQIWEKLADQREKVFFNGEEINIPENFYMITTTLSGIGSRVQLNNEHFKRLGGLYFLPPSTTELALYLNDKKKELKSEIDSKGKSNIEVKKLREYEALNNKENMHKVIYFFEKANDLIYDEYSRGLQLGQWNNLRKLYIPEQFDEMVMTFVNHVNATNPEKKLTSDSFENFFYSFSHDGKLKGSNFISTSFEVFKAWGFFTEFVVAASFAIVTALFSAYYVNKRKKLINKYLSESENIYQKYVASHLHSGEALEELITLKKEIDQDAKNGKINYAEAIFFYNSIRDRTQAIEITRNINQSFMQLVETFLEDNVISKSEHKKLNSFLEKIKFKIPKDDYNRLKAEVKKVWNEHGEKQ